MGSGRFDTKKYYDAAASYTTQTRTSLFQQSNIFSDFNPVRITKRESCASKEHPDPTSIIIACDVTGSMGKIPEDLLKGGLGKIMGSLLDVKSISNPQVMFAAIGDTECDKAPLQVTQFESDNRIESQLKNLYLEGGGGGNESESYQVIWYFAAYKTRIDSLKQGKKGILFTMGDELMPAKLSADHIRKFIDKEYSGNDIATSKLLEEVQKKYEVFHLIVQDTNTYTSRLGPNKVNNCWREYLEERAILVPNYNEIPEKIVSTVKSLCETPKINKAAFFSSKTDHEPVNLNVAKLTKDNEGIPNIFICPISLTIMEDPVVAEDGHTYDRGSISTWLLTHTTSPLKNVAIGKNLIPNHDLKSEIKQWQENQAALKNSSASESNQQNNNNQSSDETPATVHVSTLKK